MLKFFGNKDKKKQSGTRSRRFEYASQGMPISKLAESMRYMPIGKKVEYCPEFKRDVMLESVVIGYAINGHQLYSSKGIRHIDEDGKEALLFESHGEQIRVSTIEHFCFIVPFNPDDENKIDYGHRAEIGKRGIFAKGNNLTLSVKEPGGLVRTVDTTVVKMMPVKEGVYANYQVVLLDIMPDSIVSTDRRKHYRIKTRIPCALVLDQEIGYPCLMVDYSGESIRLKFEEREQRAVATLKKGQLITVDVMLTHGEQSRHYALSGFVYDRDDDNVVVILQGIIKNGRTTEFSIIDRLDMKSNLLEHPDTVIEEQA